MRQDIFIIIPAVFHRCLGKLSMEIVAADSESIEFHHAVGKDLFNPRWSKCPVFGSILVNPSEQSLFAIGTAFYGFVSRNEMLKSGWTDGRLNPASRRIEC